MKKTFFALCLLLPATVLWADTVSIEPSRDNTLYESATGALSNGAGQYLFSGRTNQGTESIRRALLHFDIAGAIPAGSTINSASLELKMDKTIAGLATNGLHRMNADWGEGTSDAATINVEEGQGAPATTGDATWLHPFFNTSAWTSPGGDFNPTASAETGVGGNGLYTWSSPGTAADAQAWLDTPANNYGWVLMGDESTTLTAKRFFSRDTAIATNRPSLVIDFTPPPGPPTAPVPVLYYNFEEGGGTTITNLGSIATNGIFFGADGDERFVPGPAGSFSPGGAIQFDGENLGNGDGINTRIPAADLGFTQSSNYTAAAWINFTKAPGDNHVFSQTNATGTVLHNGIRNSRVHMGHWGNDLTGPTILATGVWYHVVWEYNGGFERIFINGAYEAGPVARGQLNNTNIVTVGNAGPPNWGFQGMIDDVVVFNETLTFPQIQHLAAGGDPLNLPTNNVGTADGKFFTAPFGTNSTWNLYEVVGRESGIPAIWIDAENNAASKIDPSGITMKEGHLADVISREENYALSRMADLALIWIGLTDDDTVFGGSEAGNNRNGGWVWTSGLPYTYQNWNNGEPSEGGTGEDAVQLRAVDGLWNDTFSGLPPQTNGLTAIPYIIEWATGSASPIPDVPVIPTVIPADLPGAPAGDAVFGVTAVSANGNLATLEQAQVSLMSGTGTITNGVAPMINFVDPNAQTANSLINGDLPFLGNTAAVDNDILHVYHGKVIIPADGDYTFGVRSDEGCALRIRGSQWTSQNGNGIIDSLDPETVFVERATANFRAIINLTAGEHDIEFLAFQDGGTSGHELFAATGAITNEIDSLLWRPIGYQSQNQIPVPGVISNFTVRTSAPGTNAVIANLNSLANAETELANDTNIVTNTWSEIDFVDPQGAGSGGSYPGNNPFDNGTTGGDEDFALEVTAQLEIPADGEYVFGFRGDDGSSLEIVGESFSNLVFAINANSVITNGLLQHDANTGDSHTRGSIVLTQGVYDLRSVFWERGGGAHFEIFGYALNSPIPDLLRAENAQVVTDPNGLQLVSLSAPDIVFSSPSFDGTNLSVTFSSEVGAFYSVQATLDYITWTTVLTDIPSGGLSTLLSVPKAAFEPDNFTAIRVFKQ